MKIYIPVFSYLLTCALTLTSASVTTQNSMSAVDTFLSNYLDAWIYNINNTMNRIQVEQEEANSSISKQCIDHIRILLESGRNRRLWALKIFDSFGKPGSGIMEASLSFLGDFSECTGTSAVTEHEETESGHTSEVLFTGRYCLANVHLPRNGLDSLEELNPGHSSAMFAEAQPKVGICLPSSCSEFEIHRIANHVLKSFIANASLTLGGTCSGKNSLSDINSDIGALIVLAAFAACLLMVLIGTMVDYVKNYRMKEVQQDWMRSRSKTVTSVMSLTSINSEQPRPLGRGRRRKNEACIRLMDFMIAFSAIASLRKIFSSSPKSKSLPSHKGTGGHIEVLHGIRVLMMMWIITCHTFAFAMQWLFFKNPNVIKSAPQNMMSQIFANGTFSTDSFLFISGLLVTNLCMKQMRKSNGKINLMSFYLHRLVRTTPLLLAVIAFTATLLRYTGEGPGFDNSIAMYGPWCKKNWWLSALYVQNFVDTDTMCLSHSWYSAVDMQLYFIAPLILIPLYHRPRIGFAIMSLLLTASMAFTGFITITKHLPAVPYLNDMIAPDVVRDYYANVYIKPHTRIGPYLIGMALGFVLYTMEGKIRLSKTQTVIGWIAAICANMGILFAMLPVNAGYRLPDSLAALYSSTSRVIWALSWAWVTFACSAGKGGLLGNMLSSKVWLPWSRLTYSAYLIHPLVMAIFYGSRQTTFEFSHFLMSYIALGNLVLTYVASLILCMVFESPIISLEKLLTEGRSRSGSNTHVLPG